MLRALKQFFASPPFQDEAHNAYVTLVAQSRKPRFYEALRVADTVDGRFDVIVLHMFLLIHRLRRERSQEAGEFARVLSETFFSDMDRSLREMGSTDTGVGMRIKNMAQAFYGRLQAYEQALKPEVLKETLKRNLYRDAEVSDDQLKELLVYIERNHAHLNALLITDILNGRVSFSD